MMVERNRNEERRNYLDTGIKVPIENVRRE